MTHGAGSFGSLRLFYFHTSTGRQKRGTMSDETTTNEQQAPVTPTAGEQQQEPTQQTERTFTQTELDRIISERLAKERTKAEAAAVKAREEAERKAAEEQGEFKRLYEQTAQRLAETEARAKAAEIASIKREVAARLNMPAKLAERLQGETAEDIEADAKDLMAALPKPAAPNINSGTGIGAAPQQNGAMSEAEKKELAAVLGVDYRYLP